MGRLATVKERYPTWQLLLHGINAGLTAGLVFILVQMVINLALNRPFFEPLRLISTLGFGLEALDPGYSIVTASMIGLFIHLAVSAVYGIIFVFLITVTGQITAPTEKHLVYGTGYGLMLWVINFIIIAPLAYPQFGQLHPFWQGFVACTFFFGTLLGVYTAAVELGVEES